MTAAQQLDLLSTSQTQSPRCAYGAPLIAIIISGEGFIRQSCCNHWDCPCCGEIRAKQEYRRIVNGCSVLAKEHELYFWTLTCRGKECTLQEAEENYLDWTNVLLTNARTKCNRAGDYWAYVQVTERQHKTRNHPHSHIITSYVPSDGQNTTDDKGKPCIVSAWFSRANKSANLGSQHKITRVESADAVSRYVAKYLFKDSMKDRFPPKWKRVRYSQNFPQLPDFTPDFVVPLLTPTAWQEARKQGVRYKCSDSATFALAAHHIDLISL